MSTAHEVMGGVRRLNRQICAMDKSQEPVFLAAEDVEAVCALRDALLYVLMRERSSRRKAPNVSPIRNPRGNGHVSA